MNNFAFESLSADLPVDNPKDDELGYAPFAQRLAAKIPSIHASKGFVIGINGAWGLGKSTVIGMLRHYLEELDEAKQPLIVDYSPWMFSSHEDLAKRFLDQLLTSLITEPRWKKLGKQLKKPLSNFANTVGDVPTIGPYAKAASKVLDQKPQDIHALKATISEVLGKENRKIVVIIDDIDRLAMEEIRQLFRVVKAVANFPNIIYVLAFDKEIVANALKTEGASGEAYLEKIIQAPFDLPLPNRIRLQQMLFKKLDTLLADIPQDAFETDYWAEMYRSGIDPFMTTPRHVIRLINALVISYMDISDEVNPIDFIALETLRLFCPDVYDIIRRNRDNFAGHASPGLGRDHKKKERENFHNTWLQSVKERDRETVKALVMRLFPGLSSVWGNTYFSDSSATEWSRQLRVCATDRFDVYFQLNLPEGNLTVSEIKAFIGLTDNAEVFGAKLLEFSNEKRDNRSSKVRDYLGRIQAYTDKDIPLENIAVIMQAFFNVGDQLVLNDDEKQSMFDFGVDTDMGRISFQLLKRLEEPDRFECLKRTISNGTAVSTIVDRVTVFGQSHDRFEYGNARPDRDPLLTLEHIIELEKVAVGKIRQSAMNNTLFDSPDLAGTLYRWRNWGSENEVKSWVSDVISTDQGLIKFLEKMLHKTYWSSGEQNGVTPKMNLTNWTVFIEPDKLIERVKILDAKQGLTENQKTAVQQFIKEYDTLQKEIAGDGTPLEKNE